MNTKARITLLFAFAAVCHLSAAPLPLVTQAHAHNDYMHTRPLWDALDHGFCSVEADIYLVNGQLLVAHKHSEVKPGRTLQALYLDPLRERVKANGGRVFPHGPEFTLLIDLKENWRILYPALRSVLTNYAEMLATFQDGVKRTNAVLVILTGERDEHMFDGESVRYAAFDGTLGDLRTHPSPLLVPWISEPWKTCFHWSGKGTMPETEFAQLKSIANQAHQQGRRVRFWGAPDKPNFWQTLRAAGVDLINTDDLAGMQEFLRKEQPDSSRQNSAPGTSPGGR